MKMLFHLMRKDLHATRLWLVVISTLAVALVVLPLHGLITEDQACHEFSILLGWLGWLAVVLFQRSLLNLDPPLGAERFIGTKPTSGGQIILGKVCLILTMGVLPVTAAATWRLIRLDAGVTWAEALTVSAENATLLILLLGLLALPTAFPFQSAWITGISVILAATLMMFSVIILTLLPAPPTWFWYLLPIICLSLAGATGVVTHYLRRPGIHRLILSLLVGIAGACGIAATFQEKKSFRLEGTPFEQPVKIVSTHGGLSAYLHSGLPGNVVEIRQNCRLQGLPEGVFAEHWRVSGQMQLEGHEKPFDLDWDSWASTQWAVPPDIAFHAVPGTPRPTAAVLAEGQILFLPTGRATVPNLKRGQILKMTLRGTHHFELFRAKLETTLPIENEQTWTGDHLRLDMSQVSKRQSNVALHLDTDVLSFIPERRRQGIAYGVGDLGFFGVSHPGQPLIRVESFQETQTLTPLLRHRQARERLLFSLNQSWWNFSKPESTKATKEVQPTEVRLGIFRRFKIGVVSVPFEFVDVRVGVQ